MESKKLLKEQARAKFLAGIISESEYEGLTNELDASTYVNLMKGGEKDGFGGDFASAKGSEFRQGQIRNVKNLAKEHLFGKYIGKELKINGEKVSILEISPYSEKDSILQFVTSNRLLNFTVDTKTGDAFLTGTPNGISIDRRTAVIITDVIKDYSGNKNFSIHDLRAVKTV